MIRSSSALVLISGPISSAMIISAIAVKLAIPRPKDSVTKAMTRPISSGVRPRRE